MSDTYTSMMKRLTLEQTDLAVFTCDAQDRTRHIPLRSASRLISPDCHESASQEKLTSTFPTVTSPLPHSATTSPRHPGCCCCCCCPFPRCGSPSSADAAGGTTFHTLTLPSRCPLAIKWYDLPHAGAQEREVIAWEPRPWAAVLLLGVPLEVMDAEGVGDG